MRRWLLISDHVHVVEDGLRAAILSDRRTIGLRAERLAEIVAAVGPLWHEGHRAGLVSRPCQRAVEAGAKPPAQRSRIVLECADGHSTMEVSQWLRIAPQTVRTWRGRFLGNGPEGLSGEPRPGVPRTITDADVERVMVKTLEETKERDTLVDEVDGGSDRDVAVDGLADLAGVRAGPAPFADVQAVDGSAVHRQSP